jgi:hypothetical protein
MRHLQIGGGGVIIADQSQPIRAERNGVYRPTRLTVSSGVMVAVLQSGILTMRHLESWALAS